MYPCIKLLQNNLKQILKEFENFYNFLKNILLKDKIE